MYVHKDHFGNTWTIEPAAPVEHAIHEGLTVWGWRVTMTTPDGGAVTHQDPNLALALSEVVAKGGWSRG